MHPSASLSLQETKVTSSPWGPGETPFPLPRGLAAVGKILRLPLPLLPQTPEEHWSSEPGESDLGAVKIGLKRGLCFNIFYDFLKGDSRPGRCGYLIGALSHTPKDLIPSFGFNPWSEHTCEATNWSMFLSLNNQ